MNFFFEESKYTPDRKERSKTLYIAGGKTEAQWTENATNREQMAYTKLKADLAKKMINIQAPQFKWKDRSGKEMALSSPKGKTVITDFWATWADVASPHSPRYANGGERF